MLTSGVMDVFERKREKGVKVCLGTDCSGGYSYHILDAIRMV